VKGGQGGESTEGGVGGECRSGRGGGMGGRSEIAERGVITWEKRELSNAVGRGRDTSLKNSGGKLHAMKIIMVCGKKGETSDSGSFTRGWGGGKCQ